MGNDQAVSTTEVDERIKEVSVLQRLLKRPELGAVSGAILVFVFFGFTAGSSGMFGPEGIMGWLEVAGQLMLIATSACLLMIAGEFDLSLGSMIGFVGIVIGLMATVAGFPVGLSIVVGIIAAVFFGFINGLLVVKTGLPSFIVTLAFLFILRGLCILLPSKIAGRTIIGSFVDKESLSFKLFGGEAGGPIFQWLADIGILETFPGTTEPVVSGIPVVILWGLAVAFVASWVLLKTRIGNWIFAIGGDAKAAQNVGVPVNTVKIGLFMFAAFTAAIYAACQVMDNGSAAADRGLLKEFEAIIAAVIGGALLTGGYGSVIGACVGALMFAVINQGIAYAGYDPSGFRIFLGFMLLIAVVFNNYVRKRVTEAR